MKNYEELQFWDNFMFYTVMSTHEEICRKVVEICIGKKVRGIRYKEGEKSVQISPNKRGIRLDVYLEDTDNTIYDLEMQTTQDQELGLRIRYYDSLMSLHSLRPGKRYQELPQSYIIFLCRFDPFEEGRVMYEFCRRERNNPELVLPDKSIDIIINAWGDDSKCPEPMQELLKSIRGEAPGKGISKDIADAVEQIRQDLELKEKYMLFEIMMQDSRAEGLAEGLTRGKEEGLAEGLTKGKEEGLAEGLSAGRSAVLTELMQKMILAGNTDKEIIALLATTQEQVEAEREKLVKAEV